MSARFKERADYLATAQAALQGVQRVYSDGEYVVEVHDVSSDMPIEIGLAIKRADKQPIRSWRVLQDIKNAIAGPDRTALEIYPPEDEVTDTGNLYHLWVFEAGARVNLKLVPHRGSGT